MSKKSTEGKKDKLLWTQQMDDTLVDALYHQFVDGNRVNSTFTTLAYDNILKELRESFEMDIDKTKLKNRMKTIKEHFAECYDLFRNCTSGFAWSPLTRMFTAEPEVWKALIEAKPKAEKWMSTPISNYDKLVEIFGQDRATGEKAKTAQDRHKEKEAEAFDETNDEQFDSIDRIDRLVSQNDITLDSFTVGDNDVEMISPEARPGASSSKGKKRKNSLDAEKEQLDNFMKSSFSEVATAIREAATEVSTALRPKKIYKQAEIHEALSEIGLSLIPRMEAFVFLSRNVERVETFMNTPVEERKVLLDVMMRHEEF